VLRIGFARIGSQRVANADKRNLDLGRARQCFAGAGVISCVVRPTRSTRTIDATRGPSCHYRSQPLANALAHSVRPLRRAISAIAR
jgi:hypothetical protein